MLKQYPYYITATTIFTEWMVINFFVCEKMAFVYPIKCREAMTQWTSSPLYTSTHTQIHSLWWDRDENAHRSHNTYSILYIAVPIHLYSIYTNIECVPGKSSDDNGNDDDDDDECRAFYHIHFYTIVQMRIKTKLVLILSLTTQNR